MQEGPILYEERLLYVENFKSNQMVGPILVIWGLSGLAWAADVLKHKGQISHFLSCLPFW
jgi:hypothetical protein